MDSFIDSTFEFLEQETQNYDQSELEISKLIPTIGQESEQKESNMPSIPSCASPLMPFLDQVSDQLLSSASNHSLRNGCPNIEKILDSESQSPAVGSSTEVSNTTTFGTAPSSQNFDQVDSLNLPNIPELTQFQLESLAQSSLAHPMANPPKHCLSTSTQPGSKLSGVCVPPLLVTLPADQTPPAILSLNLTPVQKPEKCKDPSLVNSSQEALVPSGASHVVLPVTETGITPLPLLHLHVLPTSEIVSRLTQLKQNLKGQVKRLTHKTPKT